MIDFDKLRKDCQIWIEEMLRAGTIEPMAILIESLFQIKDSIDDLRFAVECLQQKMHVQNFK